MVIIQTQNDRIIKIAMVIKSNILMKKSQQRKVSMHDLLQKN